MLENGSCPRSLYVMHIVLFIMNSFQCAARKEAVITVPIGSVLDLNSPWDSMVHSCMEVAVSDFYSKNPNYATRLKLHTKNAQTLLDAHIAVMELLNQEQVHGVIGPLESSSAQESLLAEIGKDNHVPVISFSATRSPASNTFNNPYFVRATPDNTVQARALASLFTEFEWHEVAVLYENTDEGSHFLYQLNKALQEIEVRLAYMVFISNTDEDSNISKELNKLPTKQTRVFIVHMSPSLGSRFFQLAKSLGVMSEGYAWIISDSLSNFMNEMDSITREAMDGVLGIRPYASTSSQDFKSFRERWRRSMILKNSSSSDLNVYGLWAYDAVTALTIAVEKIATEQSSTNFRQALLDQLSSTRFEGLSGEFHVFNGNLKLSAFEVFNVYGSGEKTIGFWKPERRRMLRDLRSVNVESDDRSSEELRKVMWPGDSTTRPQSSAAPIGGVLRVGVPWKHGYTEFVNVSFDPVKKQTNATGFSIDIFYAAMDLMNHPFSYEFQCYYDTPYTDPNYDKMLRQIPMDEFDMVVGDTTIWAPRAEYVDFSQPYSESEVVLVVKNNKPMDMWIFTKPLSWELWLFILVSFIVMGGVVYLLEHIYTGSIQEPPRQRCQLTYFAPVAVLAFPETNMVESKWSLCVLLFWMFTAFILMQSYTANLSAILTVNQLKFAFSHDYYIGFQNGSFMHEFLTGTLHISESRLRSYSSAEEYHEAMSKGGKNGGIDAIFDEIPYMKILIKTYSPQYKMIGPTYRTGGFGLAFPRGSPLVSNFSKAILHIAQGPNMIALELKYFGPGYSSQDPLSTVITQQTSSLMLREFAGLYIILASVIGLAGCFSLLETSNIGRKMKDKTAKFLNDYFHSDNKPRQHANADQNNNTIEGSSSQENNINNYRNNNNGNGNSVEGSEANVIAEPEATEQYGEANNVHETCESKDNTEAAPGLHVVACNDNLERNN